jgi:hypothetical protein
VVRFWVWQDGGLVSAFIDSDRHDPDENERRELGPPIEESAGTGKAGFGQQYLNEIKRSESDA